ncbi:wall-associated receptor kinase-like 3 [Prunus yedoensis var. nudiflora]|uniref:Wall-associated receptor kinase-like 3 n=1 Tax=Prunus yedoensis var. nudiflora TaxID=2094558 RepID=A0A314UAL4_PRUYE|nr:wall-associated receptor kinase-like 3 [Prunus yedoensis var. nudiflora]
MNIISIILLLWRINLPTTSAASAPIAKPNCTTHCGDVAIPYPFGIGPNKDCYLDKWFQIDCRHTNSTTSANYSRQVPFLKSVNLELLNISLFKNDRQSVRVKNPITFFSCEGKETRQPQNLTGSPFIYSQTDNTFIAVSCGLSATLTSDHGTVRECGSICQNNTNSDFGNCHGIDCCEDILPKAELSSAFSIKIQSNSSTSDPKGDCKYAFLVEEDWLMFNSSNFRDVKHMDNVPVVLDWILNAHDYGERFRGKTDQSGNQSTPFCNSYDDRNTMICACQPGMEGNPYLLQPCQDIDECKGSNECGGDVCENFAGGYSCYSNINGLRCTQRHSAGGKTGTYKCHFFGRASEIIILGLDSGVALLLLLINAWWVHKFLKKRKTIARKKMFFKRNGGLLLEQQLSSGKVNVDKIKLFDSKELEKSTNNFSIDRILGQGGQGTVYKGMLADGRIVAIKKSEKVDKSKLSEFINEVVILSQIIHRNVVQIMGCCLETEVPLLVYEFIPNGTLSQFIQEQIEEFPLTWDMRLQIATEIAGALSYLHNGASFPIYHRDIKSANILLDEKYRAKIADFGISRSISIDQTHLTTRVHGTFGYLDPEYFQSSQFTEKSDVYSFGVVLVELLTGQKPISAVTGSEEEEYRSLATYFITSMQEDRVFNIVDAQVLKDGSETQIQVVANLARRCLNLNGRSRPAMREVTSELEAVQMSRKPSISDDQQNSEGDDFVEDDAVGHWDVESLSEVSASY